MIMSMNEWMISGKKLRERRHNIIIFSELMEKI